MKVPTGYVLQESDYPEVPPKPGQLGRWKRYTDPIVQDITIHAEYGNPIPGAPTDPPSLMSTGEEPYSSGYTAQPISTVTEEHSYIYAGGMLLRETITSGSTTRTLDFRYDNVGYPYALIYNNGSTTATYYYITNLQGDVMYLVDSNGNQVAAYTYDPYGKILSATGTMAEINPLRYRGYYYDSETGLYYLQSRYYDPNTCRFINADSYASTGQGLMGYNMFAYCANNPVNMSDFYGCFAQQIIKDTLKWINNNIIQPIVKFFNPNTNTVSGQFQDGILRGSGSLTAGYSEINGRLQIYAKDDNSNGMLGGFGKVSVGNASGKIGIGLNNFSLSLKGVGDGLTATVQVGIQYKDGIGLAAKAKASVLSGRVGTESELFGWQIEFGLSGDLFSVGAEAVIGVFPDEGFVATASLGTGLFGAGFVFREALNKQLSFCS